MPQAKDHGFITEPEVIETWPMIPATDIRRARRKGDLPFYQFPGGPHYRRQDVEAFIERKYRRGSPPARKGDAPSQPEPPTAPVASPITFKPARPVSPPSHHYETMAAEEARIQGEALARRQHEAGPVLELAAPPERPETREEEINRLRLEGYEERIRNRSTVARQKRAEAAAADKRAKAQGKERRVRPKLGPP